MSKFSPFALAGLGAFCVWASFPNGLFQIPLLAPGWPIVLYFLGAHSRTPGKAFSLGWLCSVTGIFCVMYWLSLPVHNVGGMPWPAAIICALVICAVLALQGALFSLFSYYARLLSPLPLAVFLSLSWYILEYAFALACGFPWLALAGALFGWLVLVQAADIFGAYGLSAVWLFVIFCVFFSMLKLGEYFSAKEKTRWLSGVVLPVLCGLCLGSALLFYGWQKLQTGSVETAENDFTVLMVEGNIDQNIKWDPRFQRDSLEAYMRLTNEGMKEYGKPTLVLWPETALPFFYEMHHSMRAELMAYAESINCPLLFGAPGFEAGKGGRGDKIYNRAFLLNENARLSGTYDKVHLVPFGEYVPSWLKLDFLEPLLQGVGIYDDGKSSQPLHLGGLALGILICYEGIFPWLAQERVESGANVIVDISNDGWFGNSPAPAQHLALTVLRCLEQGRWLVRATNTGISAIADPRGRVLLKGPMFRAGALYGTARREESITFFHTYGEWFPVIAFLGLCMSALPLLKRERNK